MTNEDYEDDDHKYELVTLAVPRSTKWQPVLAEQLISSFYAIPSKIVLEICVTPKRIEWRILTPQGNMQLVLNVLKALYPQAVMSEVSTVDHLTYSRWTYHAGTATRFIAPLRYVDSFQIDPLATMIQTFGNLELTNELPEDDKFYREQDDEKLIYRLVLVNRDRDNENYTFWQAGEIDLTEAAIFGLKTPLVDPKTGRKRRFSITDFSKFKLSPRTETWMPDPKIRLEKYEPEYANVCRDKINRPLRPVHIYLEVIARNEQWAKSIVGMLTPIFSQFSHSQFNSLSFKDSKAVKRGEVSVEGFFEPILSSREAAALWHLPSEYCQGPGVIWAEGIPTPEPRGEYITIGKSQYLGKLQPVRLAYTDRIDHINIIGATGVGKSTFLHNLIHQDIAHGKTLLVIDPHGDLVANILNISIPIVREEDVIVFDIANEDYPVGLNLLSVPQGVKPHAVVSEALSVIKKMFADHWSPIRMEMIFRRTLQALVEYPGASMLDIPFFLSDKAFREKVLKHVTDPHPLQFWKTYKLNSQVIEPILSRIDGFLSDPMVRRIVCQQRSLNFRKIMETNKIFLADLGGIGETEAHTIGALLISKIQLAAMSRSTSSQQQLTPAYLYVDEVQNFTDTPLDKMFSEARKFGLSLVVANQFLEQLSGPTLNAVMGNVGTNISFAIGPSDARVLTSFMQPYTVQDLVNLDPYHAIVRMKVDKKRLNPFQMVTFPPPKPEIAKVVFSKNVIELMEINSKSGELDSRDQIKKLNDDWAEKIEQLTREDNLQNLKFLSSGDKKKIVQAYRREYEKWLDEKRGFIKGEVESKRATPTAMSQAYKKLKDSQPDRKKFRGPKLSSSLFLDLEPRDPARETKLRDELVEWLRLRNKISKDRMEMIAVDPKVIQREKELREKLPLLDQVRASQFYMHYSDRSDIFKSFLNRHNLPSDEEIYHLMLKHTMWDWGTLLDIKELEYLVMFKGVKKKISVDFREYKIKYPEGEHEIEREYYVTLTEDIENRTRRLKQQAYQLYARPAAEIDEEIRRRYDISTDESESGSAQPKSSTLSRSAPLSPQAERRGSSTTDQTPGDVDLADIWE